MLTVIISGLIYNILKFLNIRIGCALKILRKKEIIMASLLDVKHCYEYG